MKNINALTKEDQNNISPSHAMELLKEGNERFVNNSMLDRNLSHQVTQTATGQNPFAAIVGCIDSRVPGEMVFDQGIGDVFNVRIAGNFVNSDMLGSLEFACKVAGSKIIVVMGHSSCGAVKGACNGVELGNLTGMLENIMPSVRTVREEMGDLNGEHPEFVQKVADVNVANAITQIREKSPVLKDMEESGAIKIVGAMYHVADGRVTFF